MPTYDGMSLSHNKEQNSAVCRDTDGPWDYCTEWCGSEREKQVWYDIAYMQNLEKG